MHKLKVLYVQPSCARGGVESVLLTLVRGCNRDKVEPHVILLEHGSLVQELRSAGVYTQVYPITHLRHIGNTLCTVARIAPYIRRHRIDVVHCNGPKSQIYGALAATLAHVPNVYWLHDLPSPTLLTDTMGDLAFLLPATLRLANATETMSLASSHPFVRRAPEILWYGIDMDQYQERRYPMAVTSSAALSKRILLMGRIQAWKGQHVLVRAAYHLKMRRRDVHIDIVGSPTLDADLAYDASLRALVQDLDVADIVTFSPHTARPAVWYDKADIVVHTSVRPEPFGLVLVEALACGKPVVATNMGGPIDITDAGRVGGLLTPPDDPEALAEAILFLLDHPDKARHLAEAGQQRVRARYGAERMVANLQAVYERIVA